MLSEMLSGILGIRKLMKKKYFRDTLIAKVLE